MKLLVIMQMQAHHICWLAHTLVDPCDAHANGATHGLHGCDDVVVSP